MRALTLTQPWATLVAIGAKRFETRGWRPREMGPLAIHAAQDMPSWVNEVVERSAAIRHHLDEHGLTLERLPRGAVLAVCWLEWVEPTTCLYLPELLARRGGPHEHALGDYRPGRWAWYLSDVRPLREPLPARGVQGLWEWTPPAGWRASEEVTHAR